MSVYKSKRLKKKHRLSFDTKRFEIDLRCHVICIGTYVKCMNNNITPNDRRVKSYARWLYHNTSNEELIQHIKNIVTYTNRHYYQQNIIGTSVSRSM